jgi:ribosome-binding factor A
MERTDRIEEEIKKIVSHVISYELKDPRLTGLISVTKVEVTKDLKYCKIFISTINSKDNNEVIEGLKASSGYVRREIGKNIRMHSTPEVKFELDNSIEYGAHIQNVLNNLNIKQD